jgi:microcystin-dependent protein
MSEQFIGEIRIFAGNFAIRSWAFCDGQLLPIAQNTALFSILGTIYGGDGRTSFGLPNLQGRAPMHPGNGPGLSPKRLGEIGGAETVTLSPAQMPSHTHNVSASTFPASSTLPSSNTQFARSAGGFAYDDTGGVDVPLDQASIENSGSGQAHNNIQPYLTVNYIICLQGIFPSRS